MITSGQVTASSAPSTLCVIPPGPCTVILSNAGAATAYIGMTAPGGALSSSNGFPLPSGGYPVPIPGYASDRGGTMSVVTAAGTATATVGWLVSRG